MSPRGVALTAANVLSAISVSHCTVFFSINVVATAARGTDIYGRWVTRWAGIREKPQLNDERRMIPIARFGLAIMSIGVLAEEARAMICRGAKVLAAIVQMLCDDAGGALDIRVVSKLP